MTIQKTKRKHKLPLTAVLSYLIVVTLVATGVSLSAYVSTASGGDEARVAKFEIVVTAGSNNKVVLTEPIDIAIKPGETFGEFTVTNSSEVAVQYFAAVNNLTQNLPIKTNVEKPQAKVLQPNETATDIVKFYWDVDETNAEYMGKVDSIQIVIIAEQID